MESSISNTIIIKTSPQPSSTKSTVLLLIFIIITLTTALLLASILKDTSSSSSPPPSSTLSDNPPLIPSAPQQPLHHHHPFIKKACTNTHYPSLCFSTVSSFPATEASFTFHRILEFSINQTAKQVETTRFNILLNLSTQDLTSSQNIALEDCIEMLDQTLYELGVAIEDLRRTPGGANLETLLSAAMTNENTCIDGFAELEELSDYSIGQVRLKEQLQSSLSPIVGMISNCLAIAKYFEAVKIQESSKNPRLLFREIKQANLLDWMTIGDRKMMRRKSILLIPNVSVAVDGTGNYTTISEAVNMAPRLSLNRYVIKIKAGLYKENVVIPRYKSNIMFDGDGMNSTVITGSRNFIDGFSTFTSATLTVVGDKFLARDLTIINTSGPEKHQAVALRVTSNAAFYHCEIISYQDTLYAHSLSQLYRECMIQGTVDFIFGNAAAIFQNCLILVRKPIPGQKNMITAQGREDPNQNTGISLQNCTIMAAPDLSVAERGNFLTYLGRPWRNYSRTVIMKSYLGDLIHPQGWCKWNEQSVLDTVEYMEYMNFGPGADTRGRVTWAANINNCSQDIERQFTVGQFLHGADEWLKSTVFPLFEFGGEEIRHVE
ncbi:hypothetical protein LguiA_036300 [Lonicera macranthoides]